jgi:DNA topoisomerase-1
MRDDIPGYSRIRRGNGFFYVDTRHRPVRNDRDIQRIRSLAIPPAWKRVWICPDASGHLQAVGYDARGRKQYRYHPEYRAIRDQTKFDRLPQIVDGLVAARKTTQRHLRLPGIPREKVLATLIRLLDVTGMRIGNEESASVNKTFGLTTLRNQHVEIKRDTLRFRFTGKSGVRHEVEVDDRRLARIVRQCHDLPGHHLFEYMDENHKPQAVSSADVNSYLREVSAQPLTARDFRTWAGTVECAVALRDIGEFESGADAKKNVVAAIRTAAQRLGNRAATCRAYYIHPAIPEAYLAGGLVRTLKNTSRGAGLLSAEEQAVLKIVKRHREQIRTAA